MRYDSLINALTKLGMKNKDKASHLEAELLVMQEKELGNWYACDAIMGRVVDKTVSAMLREGWEIEHEGYPELKNDLDSYFEEKGFYTVLKKALAYRMIYGGAVVVLNLDGGDSQNVSMPVNEKSLKGVKSIQVLNKFECYPNSDDIETSIISDRFLLPNYYRIQSMIKGRGSENLTGLMLHHSRVLAFHGIEVSRDDMGLYNYMGMSEIERIIRKLQNYHQAFDGAGTLMTELAPLVVKLKMLDDVASQGNLDLLVERMQLLSTTMSVVNAIVTRSDEEVKREPVSTSGIPEMLDRMKDQLAAVTNVPRMILFNESPTGMNSNGHGELRSWYDYIREQQEEHLREQLKKMIYYISFDRNGPFSGTPTKDFKIEFRSLYQMDDQEVADLELKRAQADQIYLQNGVRGAEDVRLERFPEDEAIFSEVPEVEE